MIPRTRAARCHRAAAAALLFFSVLSGSALAQPPGKASPLNGVSIERFVEVLESKPARASDFKQVLRPDELDALGEAIAGRVTEQLIEGKDVSAWKKITADLFPADNPEALHIEALIHAGHEAEAIVRAGDFNRLEQFHYDPSFESTREVFEGVLGQRARAKAAEHLERSEIIPALRSLALAPEAADTESRAFEKKFIEALAAARAADGSFLDQWPEGIPSIDKFLQRAAEGSSETAKVMADLYSALSLSRLKQGKIERADAYYSEMLRYRPDPSAENDAVREQIILSADTDEARQFATGRIIELQRQGKISLPLRMKMVRSGFYGPSIGSVLSKMIGGLGFILVVVFFVVLFRSLHRRAPSGNVFVRTEAEEEEEQQRPQLSQVNPLRESHSVKQTRTPQAAPPPSFLSKFLSKKEGGPGYLQETKEPDEYGRLLDLFGLDDSASADEIKAAFRQKARELHPDTGNINAESEELFREFQKAYDRIQEIRKSWFRR